MSKRKRRRATKRAGAGKGALIKGMSRRLPSELLADRLFRDRLSEIMRGYAGVYALYDGDTPYYTGLTSNLFGRLRWHLRDRHAGKWDHFVIVRIHRSRYIKDIETLLHALIDTRGNVTRGKVPKDADINRILREELRTHKRRLRAYEKALR